MTGNGKPVVAIIAPGNMGAAVGARLAENGAQVVTSLEGRSAESAKRAKAANMHPVGESEIAGADFVLSIVPPGEAQALAERLSPALTAANRKPVYVDCNAISPQSVKAIAQTIEKTDCPFADAGIIGGPPKAGYDGPRFYVSGAPAKEVARLNDCGLRIHAMDGPVGDASALKMCYGGLNKGLIAIGSALVLAAERAGVGEAFRAELATSQAPMLAQLGRGVPDMFPKSYRWVAEFDEISAFVEPLPEARVFEAIARLYERLAADQDGKREEIGALSRFFEKSKVTKA